MPRLPLSVKACLFAALLTPLALCGCTTSKKRSSIAEDKPNLRLPEDLKLEGLTKIEIIEQLGQPLATSESEVSESWYYSGEKEIWIWFKGDKVTSWQTR